MRPLFSFFLLALSLHSCFISAGGASPDSFLPAFANRQIMCSGAHLGPEHIDVYISAQQAASARLNKEPTTKQERRSILPQYSQKEERTGFFAAALPASIRFAIFALGFALLGYIFVSAHPIAAVMAVFIFGFSACTSLVMRREYPDLIQKPYDVAQCHNSDILFGITKEQVEK